MAEIWGAIPFSLNHWIVASLVVVLGSGLQVASGVGLGLLLGPVLVYSLAGETVFVSIVLNLLVSILVLPQERGEVLRKPLRTLVIGAIVGIPLGWLILSFLTLVTLKLLFGVVILLAGLQLVLAGRGAATKGAAGLRLEGPGGVISGIMCGSLALPGPVAMWSMVRGGYAPGGVRATMRALYVISYFAALVAHLVFGGMVAEGWWAAAALLPALGLGIVLAGPVKARISETALRQAFSILVLVMGLAMLGQTLFKVMTS